jgi:hypothetical protein
VSADEPDWAAAGPGEREAGPVIVSGGGALLTLADVRRWVELMDAADAVPDAAAFALTEPRAAPRGVGAAFPGGLLRLTCLGGYPRAGYGPATIKGQRTHTPIDRDDPPHEPR